MCTLYIYSFRELNIPLKYRHEMERKCTARQHQRFSEVNYMPR